MSHVAVQCAKEYSHLGYGTFGFNLVQGLEKKGVVVWTPELGEYAAKSPPNYRTIIWASVPHHGTGQWDGQKSVCFTMWESDRLPPLFCSNLHNYDLVLVPNQQNLELFSAQHPNVMKVPLGYDTDMWTPADRDMPTDQFRFLFCGAGAGEKSRKGSDIAITAFRKAFPAWETMSPSPRMVVKCLKSPPEPAPFMEIFAGAWELNQLVELYAFCHAMVLPSRGEGWGYHPQQAVATGMPAIVSEIPGHMEYADSPGFATMPVKKTKAGSFIQGDGGDWWECSVDDTVDRMRDVYANYEGWKAEAELGAVVMAERFSEVAMATKTIEAIGEENLIKCWTGSWRSFTEKVYRLEVNRTLVHGECDINSVSYAFRPSETYWVPANVRHTLIEAGYCANPDETVGKMSNEVNV